MKVYVLGSLRNPRIPEIGNLLRAEGYDAFEDWYSPGRQTDTKWMEYERKRGRTFFEAIQGYHAKHVFEFDKHHLDQADAVVMVLPCGKSAHLEFGYAIGQGKPAFMLFDGEPKRFDIMVQFATALCESPENLLECLEGVKGAND